MPTVELDSATFRFMLRRKWFVDAELLMLT